MKKIIYIATIGITLLTTSCDDFLDRQVPQGIVTGDQIASPEYVDNLVISAYAIWATGDDINSSFSLWNYDVRSDDCYKGGSGTEDGGVFNALEISKGINTTDWNINDIWKRLYQCITRANTALQSLDQMDEKTYPLKNQRIAEMRFLRGHAHFMLKQLFKKIVIVNDENMEPDAYNELSNTTYTNDEQWQKIADDFQFAYDNLPEVQIEKGRPAQAAAAAYLAKTYLYKAYRQDGADNALTGINEEDLKLVVKYTDPLIMAKGGYGLETDYSMNFLPQYENGAESVWAIQYSINDGTYNGNLNWGMGLTTPQILGCCGFPYKYNEGYIIQNNDDWSRSKGLYGYYVSLKENVDPDCDCLKKGSYWASSLNHIVIRYADVLLMRAEALIQLNDGRITDAISLINEVRSRAAGSTMLIFNYKEDYGVNFKVTPYELKAYAQDEAMKMLKWERRVEFGMESSRFFDLVRWGEAKDVINAYYVTEASRCSVYKNAGFTENKNEYLPVPFEQISASNGNYTQNFGW